LFNVNFGESIFSLRVYSQVALKSNGNSLSGNMLQYSVIPFVVLRRNSAKPSQIRAFPARNKNHESKCINKFYNEFNAAVNVSRCAGLFFLSLSLFFFYASSRSSNLPSDFNYLETVDTRAFDIAKWEMGAFPETRSFDSSDKTRARKPMAAS